MKSYYTTNERLTLPLGNEEMAEASKIVTETSGKEMKRNQ
jgi:hypothetical protein